MVFYDLRGGTMIQSKLIAPFSNQNEQVSVRGLNNWWSKIASEPNIIENWDSRCN